MMDLYHGSAESFLKVLIPNISLELKRRLYATEDFHYALVRAGRQLDLIREEYYGLDQQFELAECYPGAFKRQFDVPGSIYMVPKADFVINPSDHDEWITTDYVYPTGEMWFRSLWDRIQEDTRFKLYYFGTPEWEEYWKNVNGGLDGFLERKRLRKSKMMAMRKAARN